MIKMDNEQTLQQGNHMTKVAQNDKNGQRTDPSTGELREKSAEKRTKSAKPGKKRQKTPDPPRGIAKYPGIPYPVRRRTLPELSLFCPEVYRGITDENTLKTHRVTESARDIILTKISPRFNRRFTRNVQGHGIVPKSEQ